MEKIISILLKISRLWKNKSAPLDKGAVSDENLSKYVTGYELDMGGTASWSSERSIAEDFIVHRTTADRPNPVIFHCSTQSKGTGIRHLSVYEEENEVLCSKESKYKVITSHRDNNFITHVYLEEIK